MGNLGTTTAANRGSRYSKQKSYYTQSDIVEQFTTAMLEAGITPPDTIISDGKLYRFGNKHNCWYVLHNNGSRAAGSFGDWKQGIKVTWKSGGKYTPLSELQRQAFAAQCQREKTQRLKEELSKHDAAAQKARYIWSNAKPVPANHPYLIKKHIQSHGAKLGRENTLIIPLYNAKKELVNLQFISEAGDKRFLSGGKKKGCFYCIGDLEEAEIIQIAEGFATGASLNEHTGKPVVVAFDAGNLKEVAKAIKSLSPQAQIIIAADNDASGVGEHKAREAALAINCKYIIPPSVGDFNDHLTRSV